MNKMPENIICIDEIDAGFSTTAKLMKAMNSSGKSTANLHMITELKKKHPEWTASLSLDDMYDFVVSSWSTDIEDYMSNIGVKKVK